MSLVVLTDVTGAAVSINPDLVQGVTVAPGVSPASCFVRTQTEAFVIPGTVAAVSAALAGAAAAGLAMIVVKGSNGATLALNPAATALGLAAVRNGAGDYTVSVSVGAGFTAGTMAPAVNPLGTAAIIGVADASAPTTVDVHTFNAAGVATDGDFLLAYQTGLV